MLKQGLAYLFKALKSIGDSWMKNKDFNDKHSLTSFKENINSYTLGMFFYYLNIELARIFCDWYWLMIGNFLQLHIAETAVKLLDCMIKMAREKLDMMDGDDQMKD